MLGKPDVLILESHIHFSAAVRSLIYHDFTFHKCKYMKFLSWASIEKQIQPFGGCWAVRERKGKFTNLPTFFVFYQ